MRRLTLPDGLLGFRRNGHAMQCSPDLRPRLRLRRRRRLRCIFLVDDLVRVPDRLAQRHRRQRFPSPDPCVGRRCSAKFRFQDACRSRMNRQRSLQNEWRQSGRTEVFVDLRDRGRVRLAPDGCPSGTPDRLHAGLLDPPPQREAFPLRGRRRRGLPGAGFGGETRLGEEEDRVAVDGGTFGWVWGDPVDKRGRARGRDHG